MMFRGRTRQIVRTIMRLGALSCVALAAAAVFGAASAAAATTCAYDSGSETLSVNMSADLDGAGLSLNGSEIHVSGKNWSPPLGRAADARQYRSRQRQRQQRHGEHDRRRSSIPAGFSGSGGASITLNPGEGSHDKLQLFGSAGADHWVMGASGVDSDENGTKDITFFIGGAPEEIFADGDKAPTR